MTDMFFDSFEVHPVRDVRGDEAEITQDADADYWSVYGKLADLYMAIGDYHSREAAEFVAGLLSNKNHGLPPQ